MVMEHNDITSIIAFGYFWTKVYIVGLLYNSEFAIFQSVSSYNNKQPPRI